MPTFKNRRAPNSHPTERMEDGETLIFTRKNDPSCELTSLYFTVLKTKKGSKDFLFTFYAITGEYNEGNLVEVPNGTPTRKYVSQIAYITCTHGWIYDVTTFKQSLNPGRPTENPRRCGIGTVLTELCLIDPAIKVREDGNMAQEHLNPFPEFQTIVVEYCHNLVGLMMHAKGDGPTPRVAAKAYFTAAINMKYVLLLVDTSDDEEEKKKANELIIYPIHAARDNYDPVTGKILPCVACEDTCDAWGKRWYFCSGQEMVFV